MLLYLFLFICKIHSRCVLEIESMQMKRCWEAIKLSYGLLPCRETDDHVFPARLRASFLMSFFCEPTRLLIVLTVPHFFLINLVNHIKS